MRPVAVALLVAVVMAVLVAVVVVVGVGLAVPPVLDLGALPGGEQVQDDGPDVSPDVEQDRALAGIRVLGKVGGALRAERGVLRCGLVRSS